MPKRLLFLLGLAAFLFAQQPQRREVSGLRFESAKTAVPVIVIDSVERPSSN